ncbi:MAG: hypothetical protein JWN78_2082 [Bacteroidota bacterium]|nr:hypothetical protein [Bacteroidota bacterium]
MLQTKNYLFLFFKIDSRILKFLLLPGFMFLLFAANAQYYHPDDTINAPLKVIPPPDSIFKSNVDTTRKSLLDTLRNFQDSLFRASFLKNQKTNQKSSQNIDVPKGKHGKIDTTHYSPKKAALWALACPGLGQIYNKKYWKLPIVYGLMGAVIYFVAANVKKLREYNGYIRNAYDSVPNPSPVDQLDVSEIETYRNTYRRNVQLASFGTALVWGLSIVDAVVDAHLHSFDISDKLSMKIKPQINSFDNSFYTGLAVNLNFK